MKKKWKQLCLCVCVINSYDQNKKNNQIKSNPIQSIFFHSFRHSFQFFFLQIDLINLLLSLSLVFHCFHFKLIDFWLFNTRMIFFSLLGHPTRLNNNKKNSHSQEKKISVFVCLFVFQSSWSLISWIFDDGGDSGGGTWV